MLFLSIFFCVCVSSQSTDSADILDSSHHIVQQADSLEPEAMDPNKDDSSFYENYLEPIVAVISVALITILFFSVRSKK